MPRPRADECNGDYYAIDTVLFIWERKTWSFSTQIESLAIGCFGRGSLTLQCLRLTLSATWSDFYCGFNEHKNSVVVCRNRIALLEDRRQLLRDLGRFCQTSNTGSVGTHKIQLKVPGTLGHENNLFLVG